MSYNIFVEIWRKLSYIFVLLLLSLDHDKSCFKSLLSFNSTRIFAYILLDENLFLSYGIVILSALFSFDECDSSQIFAVYQIPIITEQSGKYIVTKAFNIHQTVLQSNLIIRHNTSNVKI